MVFTVEQEIDNAVIDEAVVKEGMVGFGIGDANGIGVAEPKSVCHGANIIRTNHRCTGSRLRRALSFLGETARFGTA